MGIWQRIFALSLILFSHKSYESNNDVLGRTETMMLVISKVENILNLLPPTHVFLCWDPSVSWCGYVKMPRIFKSHMKN